ncbi:hypothetical protein [Massilia sp. NR 4-1]|uniref:hypothetical protein n=1 Tax=Massilia sp. NR 4-1 TaxID=1678028 RepID=UPI00067D383C|nr:hypothetical protein [Massilia sp. NR 4-1]AKU20776.1 hypothetical protein ACZ75_03890 [Massilia sp. NR 4-1]
MKERTEIRDALFRLSCIGRRQFYYDPAGQVLSDGEIHYLIEVSGVFFIAWEDNDTGTMIVNPIIRFSLDELEELGAEEAWTVLHVPAALAAGIQFREIDGAELTNAYLRMKERALKGVTSPVLLGE